MSLFRLHPHLQHAIVNDLGWRDLRPVQSMTIDAVLDGANSVVLAPTAGGKTEAAIFPVLSQILTEHRKPVSVLYVCPIKALLNNQEERLRQYARMVGLDVFKWHGDVSAPAKEKFRRDPAHILLTTPESIEVMLISAKTDARALFAGLGAVDQRAHARVPLVLAEPRLGQSQRRSRTLARRSQPRAIDQGRRPPRALAYSAPRWPALQLKAALPVPPSQKNLLDHLLSLCLLNCPAM